MPKPTSAPRRATIYCVVPQELADRLHEPLRRHFADQPRVAVVVEQRWRDRRKGATRRVEKHATPSTERRLIRSAEGRRAADRRATALPVAVPAMPRHLRRYAALLAFVERVEPATQQAEDADTARLIARWQAGEHELFRELYLRYFDRVYAYMRIALRNHHDAEEGTQQVFAQVLQALDRYEARPGRPFRGWLFVIARNCAISELRKSVPVTLEDPADLAEQLGDDRASDGEVPALEWISDRDLMLFVERLPLAQRQVLVLRYLLDMAPSEVAVILGLTPLNVRKLQHRALRFLEQRLSSIGRGGASRRVPRIPVRVIPRQAVVLRERRFVLAP